MARLKDLSIRWKVAGHLLLILVLVAANLGGIWWFLNEQKGDATAINEAGKQRLLVQKMATEAHMIGMGNDERRDDLFADATEFNRTLTALIEGNESQGIPPAPENARKQFSTVRERWEPYHSHVRTVVNEPATSPAFNESLAYISSQDEELLSASDAAVARYERSVEREVRRLQLLLLGIFGLDVVVVLLLLFLIDRDILKPLTRLTQHARRVADEELDESIPVTDSSDEVGTLSQSIYEMKSKLVSTLREARKFEQAVDHAGHAVYITDTEGTIVYVNPTFEAITGYDAEYAVGQNPNILQSGQQPDSYYEDLWNTIQSGDVWEEDLVNRRSSGELFHAHQTIAPITGADGHHDGFVAIMADNTEQLVSEQQNQVLGRVLRHNLRTACNIIGGYVEELEDVIVDQPQSDYLREIDVAIDNMVEISEMADRCTRDVKEETYRQEQQVCSTVERVSSDLLDRHPAAIIESDLPEYEVDVTANVEAALSEVVANAIEHNDADIPTVSIGVSLTEGREANPPPRVRITIEDNGPGIPPTEREVLKEGRETPLFHGSGLGLWRVYWIITLAGGQITIEDRDPRGTRVTLVLPQASVRPFPRDAMYPDDDQMDEGKSMQGDIINNDD